jgi:hypothetical protein
VLTSPTAPRKIGGTVADATWAVVVVAAFGAVVERVAPAAAVVDEAVDPVSAGRERMRPAWAGAAEAAKTAPHVSATTPARARRRGRVAALSGRAVRPFCGTPK